jgi:hypothetical protein
MPIFSPKVAENCDHIIDPWPPCLLFTQQALIFFISCPFKRSPEHLRRDPPARGQGSLGTPPSPWPRRSAAPAEDAGPQAQRGRQQAQ